MCLCKWGPFWAGGSPVGQVLGDLGRGGVAGVCGGVAVLPLVEPLGVALVAGGAGLIQALNGQASLLFALGAEEVPDACFAVDDVFVVVFVDIFLEVGTICTFCARAEVVFLAEVVVLVEVFSVDEVGCASVAAISALKYDMMEEPIATVSVTAGVIGLLAVMSGFFARTWAKSIIWASTCDSAPSKGTARLRKRIAAEFRRDDTPMDTGLR